jgi:GNAT superfamily N-acetyltransferase
MGDLREVTIRAAEAADIAALCALFAEFHDFNLRGLPDRLAGPGGPGGFEPVKLEANLRHLLGAHGSNILVAESDGALLGLAEVYIRQTSRGAAVIQRTYGHLQSLIVTAAARGRGVGQQLLQSVEVWAGARGASELQIDCWEFADGPLGFYEREGYRTLTRTLVRELASDQGAAGKPEFELAPLAC